MRQQRTVLKEKNKTLLPLSILQLLDHKSLFDFLPIFFIFFFNSSCLIFQPHSTDMTYLPLLPVLEVLGGLTGVWELDKPEKKKCRT